MRSALPSRHPAIGPETRRIDWLLINFTTHSEDRFVHCDEVVDKLGCLMRQEQSETHVSIWCLDSAFMVSGIPSPNFRGHDDVMVLLIFAKKFVLTSIRTKPQEVILDKLSLIHSCQSKRLINKTSKQPEARKQASH